MSGEDEWGSRDWYEPGESVITKRGRHGAIIGRETHPDGAGNRRYQVFPLSGKPQMMRVSVVNLKPAPAACSS